ncbi:MAG: DNA topoisomerase IV subunit A [Magnetococcales bacterium]|nr:DNA topoisomerase IV subunit A [Magnetococcales bacterium]
MVPPDLAVGIETDEQIDSVPIRLELESRYLAYALSTIISRSLPDVRDGLKPVHRRILFAMRALRLDPGSGFKKSARVVGDVIGKFHPHGDQAAYDAMVRLTQDFAVRYPLIAGQGNFGNIDGDRAAAMRYTEARLTKVAWALLEDLDQDTVDFLPTYDGSQQEPTVLPSRFPNLLANGSSGIAVGMSTSIPPHNLTEIIAACLLLIDQPDSTIEQLLEQMPGPDFPTGGVLVSDRQEMLATYRSGRGTLRLRCRWHKESLGRGGWQLVITEIPYQVNKSRLIEQIAALIVGKQNTLLADVRDESDSLIRVVIEPRARTLEEDKIMAYLYRHTDLEIRVAVNLNVITAGRRPDVLDIKSLLQAWLDHRFVVHSRRARFELSRIRERLHLLNAYLLVHINIDEVIAIIRNEDEPAPILMRHFHLDAVQTEAILNLRLRALRRLEEHLIRQEIAEKEARADLLTALLADESVMWQQVRAELITTRTEFSDNRRTELAGAPEQVVLKPEELLQREPITVILSAKGWIRTMKGHDVVLDKLRFKREDGLRWATPLYSTDLVSFVTATGKLFSILADRLPAGQGVGDPLNAVFDMDEGDEVDWVGAVDIDREYFVATQLAQGFRIRGSDLTATQRKGRQVFLFKPGDHILRIQPISGAWIASICSGRYLLVCRLEEFPLLPRGKGVRIQRLLPTETLTDVTIIDPNVGVTLDSGRRTKQFTDLTAWLSQRATRGSVLPHGFLSGVTFAQVPSPPDPLSHRGRGGV